MKAIRTIVPLALIAAVVAVPAVAFDGFGPGGHHRGHGGPGGPGLMIGERLLHMGCEIGLTDDQRASIEAILEATRPEAEAILEAMQEAREAWRESHDPTVFDEAAARAFADAQAGYHADLMVLGMDTAAQVLAVLTAEQIEQLEEIRDTRRERRGGARFGR